MDLSRSQSEGVLRPVLGDVNMADSSETLKESAKFSNNPDNLSFGTACKENLKPEGLTLTVPNPSFQNISFEGYESDDTSFCLQSRNLNLTSLADQLNNLHLETPRPPKKNPFGKDQSPTVSRPDSCNSLYTSVHNISESETEFDLSQVVVNGGSSPSRKSPHNVSNSDENQTPRSKSVLNGSIDPEGETTPVVGRSPLNGNTPESVPVIPDKEVDCELEFELEKNPSNLTSEEQPESISSTDSATENCAADESYKTASNPDLASIGNEESNSANNFYSAKSGTDGENHSDDTIVVENCTEISECSENLESSVCVNKDLNHSITSQVADRSETQVIESKEPSGKLEEQAIQSEEEIIQSKELVSESIEENCPLKQTVELQQSSSPEQNILPGAHISNLEEKIIEPEEQNIQPKEQIIGSEEPIVKSVVQNFPPEEQINISGKQIIQSEELVSRLEEQVIGQEKGSIQLEEQSIKFVDQKTKSEESVVKSDVSNIPPEEQINNSGKLIIKPEEPIIRSEEQVIGREEESICLEEQSENESIQPEERSVQFSEQIVESKEQSPLSKEPTPKSEEQITELEKEISEQKEPTLQSKEPVIESEKQPEEQIIDSTKQSPEVKVKEGIPEEFSESWNSEAGPVTAAEEIFEDPATFDFLVQRGNNAINSNLCKKSLFVKFDPLVNSFSPSQIEERITAAVKMADENSGDEKYEVQSKKSPSPITPLKNPALEAVGKLIEASPNVPGVNSKALEAELAKLQELLIQQEKEFKEKIQKMEKNEAKLKKELNEKAKNKDRLSTMLNEYEKTISQMVAQKEVWDSKLKAAESERDTTMQHLNNLEIAFNDVHQKYERSKVVIESLKQNEDILKGSVQEYDAAIKKQENKYEMLKQHAKSQLEKANQELDVRTKSQEAESAKLRALLKKAELRTSSLEQALEQKTKENQELMKICDELINKVGSS